MISNRWKTHSNLKMQNPFVSIVVPMYNSKETIESCLDSLIKQDYPQNRQEIIIVDDHSTDNSAKIVRDFSYINKNIKLLRQPDGKKGPAAARNLGIRRAKGEIIAFTDSDCIVPKNWLKKMVECFNSNPDYSAIGGSLVACASKKFITFCEGAISDCLGHKALIAAPNSSFRRDCLFNVGLFDETFVSGEDPDLVWNLEKQGYKVMFLKNLPVIHHYYRSTFKNFVRHNVWYGRGRVLLAKNHPEKFSFAEKNFIVLEIFIVLVTAMIVVFNIGLIGGWILLNFVSLLIFSFSRRSRLNSKILADYGFFSFLKCILLFPISDIANLYGMTKQKLMLK